MFDEPSSYLDVKQRLAAARTIRNLLRPDDYVIVVEHDLSVLDYLSDFICVLYGKPAVYGGAFYLGLYSIPLTNFMGGVGYTAYVLTLQMCRKPSAYLELNRC